MTVGSGALLRDGSAASVRCLLDLGDGGREALGALGQARLAGRVQVGLCRGDAHAGPLQPLGGTVEALAVRDLGGQRD